MIFRRLFLLSIVVFGAGRMPAQTGFRFGPTGMFLSSRSSVITTLPDRFYFRYKSGFGGGLAVQYGFTPGFTLGSGISYTYKGYRVFNDSNSQGTLLRHNMSNLELPVNMIFRIRMNTSSNLRGILGATLNYNMSKNGHEETNSNGSFIIREEIVNQVYPMANLGVEIANENKSGNVFCFGIHYKQAFTQNTHLKVYDSKTDTDPLFLLGYRGSYIGVSFTYLFNPKNFKRDEEIFY